MTITEISEIDEQRSLLFLALLKAMQSSCSFRTRLHSDGSPACEGCFIAGTDLGSGQMTFNLPIEMWDLADFLPTRKLAPETDVHSSQDVCERLRDLLR
jgi:hypothetical protein